MSTPYHGGNLSDADARFGSPENGWLDLSTGINPNPYAAGRVSAERLQRLPHDGDLAELMTAARAHYNTSAELSGVAAPGTQAILQCLPSLRERSNVAILGPTYEEHAITWRAAGHTVEIVSSLDETDDADVVVVVNPNNPDGRIIPRDVLTESATSLGAHGGLLVIDEAFADVTPGISICPTAPHAGLLVLRSLGKFFGLAGLRLGFAFGDARLVEGLRQRLGPWSVSGPAIEIGTQALSDTGWIDQTRDDLSAARDRLDQILDVAGVTVVGGTDLFRLVETPEAETLFEALAWQGILTRPFPAHPNWLRIGLPGSPENEDRLKAAITVAHAGA